jgi:tetratricopeptide (TPR) repeat protein
MRNWATEQSILDHMIELNPRSALAYNALGSLYLHHHDLIGAEKALRTATTFIPDFRAPHEGLATLLFLEARVEESIKEVRLLIEMSESGPREYRRDYVTSFTDSGNEAMKIQRYADAARYYDEALKYRPWDEAAKARLAAARAAEKEQAATRPATTRGSAHSP